MKKILLTTALLFSIALMGWAQESDKEGAAIAFEKEVHDFGTLDQNAEAVTEFKFTNTGTLPLVISNARGSCGCTVPEWPKTPVPPGESASIKVKYDSSRLGAINKTVTITSNAVDSPTKIIRIKGNVVESPAE